MRVRHSIWIPLVLVSTHLSSAVAQQRPAFEFRGHRLGEERGDGLQECSAIEGPTTDQVCSERTQIGLAPVVVYYRFYEDKLGGISVKFSLGDYNEIVAMLTRKFGRSRRTMLLGHRVDEWRTRDGTFLISDHEASELLEGVGAITAPWARKLEDRRKAAERDQNGI